jgi:L-lysine exporter family protein LysE/ArgO
VTNALGAGLLTGLSLIVAIGAQNAYVLRLGLDRAHVAVVVAVCALSDVALIIAGVAGLGAVVQNASWALPAARWLGVAFLSWYAVTTAWRSRRPGALAAADAGPAPAGGPAPADGAERAGSGLSRPATLRRMLALTWLNPHVYVDTVVLLGSVAATHGPAGRWWFAAGACLGSTLWFTGLGYGARLLAPLLTSPRAWQLLDLAIAATMLLVAFQLATG